MKRNFLILILFFSVTGYGQQTFFSHINHTRSYINPAFAGTEKINNLILGHRSHPASSIGDYATYYLAYQQPRKFLHGGFGFQLINDLQGEGAISKISAGGIYAYHFKINNNLFARAAIEPSFTQISVNQDKLKFPNMFDAQKWELMDETEYIPENLSGLNHHYIEFNAGIVLTHKNYLIRNYRDITVGLAVHHINQPNYQLNYPEEKIYRRYSVYFDMNIGLMKKRTLKDIPVLTPVFLLRSGKDYQMLQYGFMLKYLNIEIGTFLRNNLLLHYIDPIIYAGFSYSSFSINYSYDIPIANKMEKNFISGAHEVTFTINFQYKGKNK